MDDKPTLQEIANMPLSKSLEAMRKHYDPDWKNINIQDDGVGNKWVIKCTTFLTQVHEYNHTLTVEADSLEEAKAEAYCELEQDVDCIEMDVKFHEIKRIADA